MAYSRNVLRAVTLTLMHGMLSTLEHAADAAEQAIIVLHPGGRIQFATGAARASLSELPSPGQPNSLPEPDGAKHSAGALRMCCRSLSLSRCATGPHDS